MKNLTISSQVFTKNSDFEILERIPYKIRNYHIINNPKYTFRCVHCGTIFKYDGHHLNRVHCKYCERNKYIKSLIGLTFGPYEIISLNKFSYKNSDTLMNVKCIYCHTQYIKSITSLKNSSKFIRCKNCSDLYQIRTEKHASIQAPINAIYGAYKRGAIDRNLEWNLTKDLFTSLIFQNCHYCGSEPELHENEKRYNRTTIDFKRNGIDRINSKLGYTLNNCVPCCEMCNRMKLNYSIDDFKNHIVLLYNNFVNKGSTTIESTDKSGSELSTSQANGDGNGEYPILDKEIV